MSRRAGARGHGTAIVSAVAVLFLAILSGGCGGGGGKETSEAQVTLQGAGASFPYPLYSKWTAEYERIHPNVRINYQSIGSGGGIRQILEGTVDFAGSDAFMSDAELGKAPKPLLHVPMTLGAVVVTYEIPGGSASLRLTPDVIADAFLGRIAKWNDPRITALNHGVALPDLDIKVIHRSDGSGTTAIFTGYLSAVSPEWAQRVGSGTSVSWPVGLGAKGNEGVAGQIKVTPGSIGYVELAYAKQLGLPIATVRNREGAFVEPTLESISAAAANVPMPPDFRVSIVNAPGPASYPIASFTWILLYRDQNDPAKANALASFLWWAIHDGQAYGQPLNYAPLPREVVAREEGLLESIMVSGKPVTIQGTGSAPARAR